MRINKMKEDTKKSAFFKGLDDLEQEHDRFLCNWNVQQLNKEAQGIIDTARYILENMPLAPKYTRPIYTTATDIDSFGYPIRNSYDFADKQCRILTQYNILYNFDCSRTLFANITKDGVVAGIKSPLYKDKDLATRFLRYLAEDLYDGTTGGAE